MGTRQLVELGLTSGFVTQLHQSLARPFGLSRPIAALIVKPKVAGVFTPYLLKQLVNFHGLLRRFHAVRIRIPAVVFDGPIRSCNQVDDGLIAPAMSFEGCPLTSQREVYGGRVGMRPRFISKTGAPTALSGAVGMRPKGLASMGKNKLLVSLV